MTDPWRTAWPYTLPTAPDLLRCWPQRSRKPLLLLSGRDQLHGGAAAFSRPLTDLHAECRQRGEIFDPKGSKASRQLVPWGAAFGGTHLRLVLGNDERAQR